MAEQDRIEYGPERQADGHCTVDGTVTVQTVYLQRRSRGWYNGIPVATFATTNSGLKYTTRNGEILSHGHMSEADLLARF